MKLQCMAGSAALLFLSLTVLSCASSRFEKVKDGYRIELPVQIAQEMSVDEIRYLTVVDPEKGSTSVEGRLRRAKRGKGTFVFEADDVLEFAPVEGNEIFFSVQDPCIPFVNKCGCFPPEFFEDGGTGDVCLCFGTTFCLPGECQCL